ncbi:MAG: hypothetical protein IKB75_05700 [Clostridia bacterium]|nr:hypothetical protein [Clostridia bacterium]
MMSVLIPQAGLLTVDWGAHLPTVGIAACAGALAACVIFAILWRGTHQESPKQDTSDRAPTVQATPAAAADDGAVVAAIIAAISALRAEEGKTSGFRVVSFRRVGKNSRKSQ